jgi:O-antigen ligase
MYIPNLTRTARIGLLGLAVVIFVFAQSLTAQLYAVASILLYPVYARWANSPKHHVLLLIGFAIIVLFASDVLITKQQSQQTVVLNRFEEDVSSDISVSGRIHLWQASLDAIRQKPVFGYGYQAPFTPGAPVFNSLNWVGWRSAHNIALDILLHIGIVGLLLFAVHYLMNLKMVISIFQSTRQSRWGLCLVFILFFVVSSLIDGNGFASRNMWWVIYVAFSITMRAFIARIPQTYNPVNN